MRIVLFVFGQIRSIMFVLSATLFYLYFSFYAVDVPSYIKPLLCRDVSAACYCTGTVNKVNVTG